MATLAAADRFAIEDLFARYHWALDMADTAAFVDTLVDDAVVEIHFHAQCFRYQGAAGMAELIDRMRAWNRFPGCQHHGGQLLLEADEQGWRARSFLLVAEARGEPPYSVRYAGRSDDRLVRHDGQWRFGHRIVRLWDDAARRNGMRTP